jgi:hypothetical protein
VTAWLDAGALVAVDKRKRHVGALLRILQRQGIPICTTSTVVAQVWRDGARQANLARVLSGVEVRPLDEAMGRRDGELQGLARTRDVIDAHLALEVGAGDHLLTSDPHVMTHLLAARGVSATVTRV